MDRFLSYSLIRSYQQQKKKCFITEVRHKRIFVDLKGGPIQSKHQT